MRGIYFAQQKTEPSESPSLGLGKNLPEFFGQGKLPYGLEYNLRMPWDAVFTYMAYHADQFGDKAVKRPPAFQHFTRGSSPSLLVPMVTLWERWDLEPKTASLWWTSAVTSEEKTEIDTKTGRHRIPLEEHFKILGFSLNRQQKTKDCLEERMQNANKAWCRDKKIYRSRDVPWRATCMVEHVYGVPCFGSENLPWSHATLDKIKGWETKAMRRFISIQKKNKMRCGQTKEDLDKDDTAIAV